MKHDKIGERRRAAKRGPCHPNRGVGPRAGLSSFVARRDEGKSAPDPGKVLSGRCGGE